jgi:hypothetical protein
MSARIRRGTLAYGGAAGLTSPVADNATLDWNDSHEFDRSKGDEEFSGKPVEISRGGSGSFELLAGHIPTGYLGFMTFTYKEVDMATGSEVVTTKRATFTLVTVNGGGNVPAEGRGSRRFAFEYGTCTVATVT